MLEAPTRIIKLGRVDPTENQPTYVILRFTKPMDAKSVTNRKNYVLVDTGKDQRLGTDDDKVVGLAGVKYNAKRNTAIIATREHLLFRERYALIVKSGSAGVKGLRSASGLPLDGKGLGIPGSNAKIKFGPGRYISGLAGAGVRVASRANATSKGR